MAVPLARNLLSGLIVLILAAQLVVGFTYHGGTRWPFISYPMYAGAKQEGARINEFQLVVRLDDQSGAVVHHDEIGLSKWLLQKNVISPILANGQPARALIDRLCDIHPNLDQIVVRDVGIAVGKDGPMQVPPIDLGHLDAGCAPGEGDNAILE